MAADRSQASRPDRSDAFGILAGMAYDERLAERVRQLLADEPGVTEKRMFGGLAFLVEGRMSVSVSGSGGLLLRVDPAEEDHLLAEPHVRRVEMRGRSMTGWLHVLPEAAGTDDELERWTRLGVDRARSLPPG
jgi:TfoX/Sxy family transcriptional regulator of competence genes